MKNLFALLILSCFIACSSSKKVTENGKCIRLYKKGYGEILNEKHKTVFNNDTIEFNEIRFNCVNSSYRTEKIMYDKFGKWNKAIFPINSQKHPILMWRNIDLLSNGKKYSVFADGIESSQHMYASIMVFDAEGKDLLDNESDEKEILTVYFANLVKKHKDEKNDFHQRYSECFK